MEIEEEITVENQVKQNIKAHLLNIFDIYTNILIPNHKTYTNTEGDIDESDKIFREIIKYDINIIKERIYYHKSRNSHNSSLKGGVLVKSQSPTIIISSKTRKRKIEKGIESKSKRDKINVQKRPRDSDITVGELRRAKVRKVNIDYYKIFRSNLNLHIQDDYTRYSNALIYIRNQSNIIYVQHFYNLLKFYINNLQYTDKKQSGGKRRKYKHTGGELPLPLCGKNATVAISVQTGPLRIKSDAVSDAVWLKNQKELMKPFLYHLNEAEKEDKIIVLGTYLQQDLSKDLNLGDRGGYSGKDFRCGKHLAEYRAIELEGIIGDAETKLVGPQFLEDNLEPLLQNFSIRDTKVSGLKGQITDWQNNNKLVPIPTISGLLDSAGHSSKHPEYNITIHKGIFEDQLKHIINPGIKCYKNYYPSLDKFTIEINLSKSNGLLFSIRDTLSPKGVDFPIQFGDTGKSTIGAIKGILMGNTKDDFFKYLESQGCNNDEIISVYFLIKGMGDFLQILDAIFANNNFEGDAELKNLQKLCHPEETIEETVLMSADMGVLKICHYLQVDFFIGTGDTDCTKNDKIYWRKLGSYIGKYFADVLKNLFKFCVKSEKHDITLEELQELIVNEDSKDSMSGGGGKKTKKKQVSAIVSTEIVEPIKSGMVYIIDDGKTHIYLYFVDSSKTKGEMLDRFFIITIDYDITLEEINKDTNKQYQDLVKEIYKIAQIELDKDRYIENYKKISQELKELEREISKFDKNKLLLISKLQNELVRQNLGKSAENILDKYSSLLTGTSTKLREYKNIIEKWRDARDVQITNRQSAIEKHLKIEDLDENTRESCTMSLNMLIDLKKKIDDYDIQQRSLTVSVIGSTEALTEDEYVNDIITEVLKRLKFFINSMKEKEKELREKLINDIKRDCNKKINEHENNIKKYNKDYALEKLSKDAKDAKDAKISAENKLKTQQTTRLNRITTAAEEKDAKINLEISDTEFKELVMKNLLISTAHFLGQDNKKVSASSRRNIVIAKENVSLIKRRPTTDKNEVDRIKGELLDFMRLLCQEVSQTIVNNIGSTASIDEDKPKSSLSSPHLSGVGSWKDFNKSSPKAPKAPKAQASQASQASPAIQATPATQATQATQATSSVNLNSPRSSLPTSPAIQATPATQASPATPSVKSNSSRSSLLSTPKTPTNASPATPTGKSNLSSSSSSSRSSLLSTPKTPTNDVVMGGNKMLKKILKVTKKNKK